MKNLLSTFLFFLICSSGAFAQLTFTTTSTPSCNHDGSVTFSFSNGTAPYTISYYDQVTQTNVTVQGTTVGNLAPGYYFFYMTDASGMNGYYNTQITSLITYTLAITPETCGWSNGAISVAPLNGTPPFSVVWQNQPPVLNLTNLPSGQYFGVLSDASGCQTEIGEYDSLNTSVMVPDSNTMTFQTVTTVSNCNNGTAMVSPANGLAPYTFTWNLVPVQNGATATGLAPNVPINVVITDANGCMEDTTIYLSSTVNINLTSNTTLETCLQANGSATVGAVGGTAPYTYLWSTGSTTATINNLTMGYYQVVVTDVNGCIGNGGAYVSRTSPISGNPTSTPSSCMVDNGTATVSPSGGTPPYTFLWSTNPPQTTQTATGLAPLNSYGVLITDANGCTRSGFVNVSQSSTLSINLSSNPEQCNLMNGSATVNVSGGVAPFSYLWSNGATTPSINGLQHGTYTVTVTDAASCVKTKSKLVGHVSPISLNINSNPASCVFTADGSISAVASGGTPPYNFQWSNGATGSTATGLLPGQYSVYVTDATGCFGGQSMIQVGYSSTTGCASQVSGNVFQDLNGNCIRDINEPGIANVWICAQPSGGCEQTDYLGNYSFLLAPGNYDIVQQTPPAYLPACPSGAINLTAVAGTNYPGQNFADTSYFVVNHQVLKTNLTLPVTGNTYTQIITAKNLGSTSSPAVVVHRIDPGLTFVSSTPNPSAFNAITNELTYSPLSISPAYPQNIHIQLQVPTNMLLGTSLVTVDTISCSVPDDFPVNNWVNILETVVGPYDPNYISVNPKGIGAEGYILESNPELEYEIHFQNTGTYPAQNVVLTDTIDPSVDLSSFQLLASSHSCTVSVDANRLMTFSFPNINLPDSSSNLLGSNGFVRFKFNQLPNLPVGTIITGTAAIYFDYNPPVITNMARNEIALPTGLTQNNFNFSMQPNPATDVVNLQMKENGWYQVSVTDISGKVLLKRMAGKSFDLNVSAFPAGVYLVEITGNNGREVKKLMVTGD